MNLAPRLFPINRAAYTKVAKCISVNCCELVIQNHLKAVGLICAFPSPSLLIASFCAQKLQAPCKGNTYRL